VTDNFPVYLVIADGLRDAITNGDYPPGARVPGARILAKQHGVSVEPPKQALRLLAAEGYLRIVHGTGCFVTSPEERAETVPCQPGQA
jgi:GntR family transcriptional regulator